MMVNVTGQLWAAASSALPANDATTVYVPALLGAQTTGWP